MLTVLINNYNYGRYLSQAVDSALGQTYEKVEVIVVDDGSIDESRAILGQYGDRIRTILKPNGGQASAFNAGFAESRGDIVCLLDSDDWFFTDKADQIAAAFLRNPEAQWVFHPVVTSFADGHTGLSPPDMVAMWVDIREEAASKGKMRVGVAPPTSGLCFRRAVLGSILPMAETIRITSDNYLKLAAMTLAPGVYLDRPLCAQRIHSSNAYTLRPDRLLTQARTHLLIAKELRSQFPQISLLSNNVFSKALADFISAGTWDRQGLGAIYWYLRDVSFGELLNIMPRTFYHLANSTTMVTPSPADSPAPGAVAGRYEVSP
jgi:glycosyltransferase involved in cell wall biosynthesis